MQGHFHLKYVCKYAIYILWYIHYDIYSLKYFVGYVVVRCKLDALSWNTKYVIINGFNVAI